MSTAQSKQTTRFFRTKGRTSTYTTIYYVSDKFEVHLGVRLRSDVPNRVQVSGFFLKQPLRTAEEHAKLVDAPVIRIAGDAEYVPYSRVFLTYQDAVEAALYIANDACKNAQMVMEDAETTIHRASVAVPQLAEQLQALKRKGKKKAKA